MRKLYVSIAVISLGLLLLFGCRHTLVSLKRANDDKKYLSSKYKERPSDYYNERKALDDAEKKNKLLADYVFNIQNYEKAEQEYISTIDRKPDKKDGQHQWAMLQLARLYYETRQFEKCVKLYDECVDGNIPGLAERDINNYIDLLKRQGEISKAYTVIKQYQSSVSYNTRFSNVRKSVEQYHTFLEELKYNKVDAYQLNLGLKGYQYGLALYKKGVVFMSNLTLPDRVRSYYVNSKMYYVDTTGLHSMNSTIRYTLQVGPVAFYNNYNSIIYTTNAFRKAVKTEKQEIGSLVVNNTQLVSGVYIPDKAEWRNTGRISKWMGRRISEKYSFMHPFVAEVGTERRLFFSSNMPGGYGGMDLYYATWIKRSQGWGHPVNLGPKINTNGDELYPVFYPAGSQQGISGGLLLFVSNGHEGYGGLDMYVTRMNDSSTIVHLPYPYNTQFDDHNPVWDKNNDLFYFSSDRAGNQVKDKIYAVNMRKFPLELLGYSPLVQEELPEPERRVVVDKVPPPSEPFRVLFEFDSDQLTAAQLSKLDSAVNKWNNYSDANIIVEGHTDNVGADDYNYNLSRERAQAVFRYLAGKGVPVRKLVMTYYGATRPLVTCPDRERNRTACIRMEAINRRCDIYIRLNK